MTFQQSSRQFADPSVSTSPARWMTHSLRSLEWGGQVGLVLSAALAAVEPGAAIESHLRREGNTLLAGEETYDLARYQRVYLVGAGKAAVPMGLAAARTIGDRLSGGLLVTKDGHQGSAGAAGLPNLDILTAGHPLPDERSCRAAVRIETLLANAGSEDLVIFVLSGGGSALLTSPVEGVSLQDLQSLTNSLLASGATIDEMNTLRKHLERMKGGGFARFAAPASVVALILSDVVGSRLDVIASGPTSPDPTTYKDALAILQRCCPGGKAPQSILNHLSQGAKGGTADTPKPGDPIFKSVQNIIIGSNYQAAQAASRKAASLGWNSAVLTTFLQGEARQVGQVLTAVARQVSASNEPIPRPACVIAGGETTVTLSGDGLGGRNQELALSTVPGLAGLEETVLVALATDGGDGPTDAAGAVASGESLTRAQSLGMDPEEYLRRNDAYRFFKRLDDLLITGPTLTNVNDLVLLFLGETSEK